MSKEKKLYLAVGIVLLTVLGSVFVYNNIILPAPFKEELKACLSEARSLENEKERDSAENICFRTYPHFN